MYTWLFDLNMFNVSPQTLHSLLVEIYSIFAVTASYIIWRKQLDHLIYFITAYNAHLCKPFYVQNLAVLQTPSN